MYRNRKLAVFPVFVRIPHQLDKDKGHEQGREEVKGGILIGSNAEVGAFLPSRLCQVDFIVASDLADEPVLEYLKPGSQTDDDAAAHRIGGLLEDVVRCLGRVRYREQVKQAVQFLL